MNEPIIFDVKEKIDDLLWTEYNRIKDLDYSKRTKIESDFFIKFSSWDNGDCSITGILVILLWYIASLENTDVYRNNE